ncbi:hypothetical protein AJ80_03805 [Polytolypa hystricis UAMH7299]|uniref:Nucleolar protein Dnt1-like N-terminal domain-containing protein n=1 Tax=Polytolypa hystricis (strain UAMH7299) TaxID=1447883 RepID=A0A2B7YEM8_POLH7|nr:hypothetical protein AJ80_03805 [Polytolypa hystricis UAMH7299]
MVLLRLTIKVLPREQLGAGGLASIAHGNNTAAEKATSFLLILPDPEKVKLSELAYMITEKWSKLRPEAEPLEIKRLLDDQHDTGELDADLTAADVFVDTGKARADGLDQRAAVRVIQKPASRPPVRYGSVVQDWSGMANNFSHLNARRPRPPVPLWSISEASIAAPSYSGFEEPIAPVRNDSHHKQSPLMSTERDEEDEYDVPRGSGVMSPVLVEDSQPDREVSKDVAGIPTFPNGSTGDQNWPSVAVPDDVPPHHALAVEITTSLAAQTEALKDIERRETAASSLSNSRSGSGSKLATKSRRSSNKLSTKKTTNPPEKPKASNKRRASDGPWDVPLSDADNVSDIAGAVRPGKKQKSNHRKSITIDRDIDTDESVAELPSQPVKPSAVRTAAESSKNAESKSQPVALAVSTKGSFARRLKKPAKDTIATDQSDVSNLSAVLKSSASRTTYGRRQSHVENLIDSDIDMMDATMDSENEENQQSTSTGPKATANAKEVEVSNPAPDTADDISTTTKRRSSRLTRSSAALKKKTAPVEKEGSDESEGESDDSMERFQSPRRKKVKNANSARSPSLRTTASQSKSPFNDLEHADPIDTTTGSEEDPRRTPPEGQMGLGITSSPPKNRMTPNPDFAKPVKDANSSALSKRRISTTPAFPKTGTRSLGNINGPAAGSAAKPQTPLPPAIRSNQKSASRTTPEQRRSVSFADDPNPPKSSSPMPSFSVKRPMSVFPSSVNIEWLLKHNLPQIDLTRETDTAEESEKLPEDVQATKAPPVPGQPVENQKSTRLRKRTLKSKKLVEVSIVAEEGEDEKEEERPKPKANKEKEKEKKGGKQTKKKPQVPRSSSPEDVRDSTQESNSASERITRSKSGNAPKQAQARFVERLAAASTASKNKRRNLTRGISLDGASASRSTSPEDHPLEESTSEDEEVSAPKTNGKKSSPSHDIPFKSTGAVEMSFSSASESEDNIPEMKDKPGSPEVARPEVKGADGDVSIASSSESDSESEAEAEAVAEVAKEDEKKSEAEAEDIKEPEVPKEVEAKRASKSQSPVEEENQDEDVDMLDVAAHSWPDTSSSESESESESEPNSKSFPEKVKGKAKETETPKETTEVASEATSEATSEPASKSKSPEAVEKPTVCEKAPNATKADATTSDGTSSDSSPESESEAPVEDEKPSGTQQSSKEQTGSQLSKSKSPSKSPAKTEKSELAVKSPNGTSNTKKNTNAHSSDDSSSSNSDYDTESGSDIPPFSTAPPNSAPTLPHLFPSRISSIRNGTSGRLSAGSTLSSSGRRGSLSSQKGKKDTDKFEFTSFSQPTVGSNGITKAGRLPMSSPVPTTSFSAVNKPVERRETLKSLLNKQKGQADAAAGKEKKNDEEKRGGGYFGLGFLSLSRR